MKRLGILFLSGFIAVLFSACSGGVEVDCVDDIDCPEDSLCVDGVCQGEECIEDADCLDDLAVCVDGLCVI